MLLQFTKRLNGSLLNRVGSQVRVRLVGQGIYLVNCLHAVRFLNRRKVSLFNGLLTCTCKQVNNRDSTESDVRIRRSFLHSPHERLARAERAIAGEDGGNATGGTPVSVPVISPVAEMLSPSDAMFTPQNVSAALLESVACICNDTLAPEGSSGIRDSSA